MKKLLIFLQGKKGSIATLLTAINGYLALKNVYGEPEFVLISIAIGVLTGTASYATKKIYK